MARAQDILSRLSPEMLSRLKKIQNVPQERLAILPEETRKKFGRVLALRNVALSMDEPEPVDLGMSPTGQALRGFLRAGGLPVDPSAIETSPAPNRALSSVGGLIQPIASDISTAIGSTVAGAATGALAGPAGVAPGATYGFLAGTAATSLNRQATERAAEAYRNRLEAEKMVRSREPSARVAGRLILEEEPTSLFGAGVARVSEAPVRTAARLGLDLAVGEIGRRVGGTIFGGKAVEDVFQGSVQGAVQTARTRIGKEFGDVAAGVKGVIADPAARAQALRSAAKASALGGGLNATQYALTEKIEDRPIDVRQLLAEAALGGALDVGVGAGIEGLRLSRIARERLQAPTGTPELEQAPQPEQAPEPEQAPQPEPITPDELQVTREAVLPTTDGTQAVTSEEPIIAQEGDVQNATQEVAFQESGVGEYPRVDEVLQADGKLDEKSVAEESSVTAADDNIPPQSRKEETLDPFDEFLSEQGKDAERRKDALEKYKAPGETFKTRIEKMANQGATIIPGPPTKGKGTPNKNKAIVSFPSGKKFNAQSEIGTNGLAYLEFLVRRRDAQAQEQAVQPAATTEPISQTATSTPEPTLKASKQKKKVAKLPKESQAKLRDATSADPVSETFFLSPIEDRLESDKLPEPDVLGVPKPKELFDGEKVSENDVRFNTKIDQDGQTPINPEETHAPIKSLSQFLVLLSQIAKNLSQKSDAFFPILRNPENLFDTNEGFQVVATTSFKDMQTYLSNKLGQLGDDQAAFIAAHEISHMMDPGRVFGSNRSLYERVTGEKISGEPNQEQNYAKSKFQSQAELLSKEFRGPMEVPLGGPEVTQGELDSAEVYSAKRREPGELFADVLAAVMIDPNRANDIAPDLTLATLRMLNQWFPNVSKSLTDFYRNLKTDDQRLARSQEFVREGSIASLAEQAKVDKQRKELGGGLVDQTVERLVSKSRSIIAALRSTGRTITKEIRDKVYAGISAITGTNLEQIAAAGIIEDMIGSAEASGVGVEGLQKFLLAKSKLGMKEDSKLSALGLSKEDATKILDELKQKNSDWFDGVSTKFNELMGLKNGIIRTAYQKGAFGKVGDRKAMAIRDRLLRDWVPMQKAEGSATLDPNPTKQGESFLLSPALDVASISEAIGKLSKANKTWELIQSLPDKGAGLFVTGKATDALSSPVTTWDENGEISTNAYYTFKPIADLFDKPQGSKGIERTLGEAMKLSNKVITRFPWFIVRSLFKDTVEGTVFTFFLSDGVKGASVYARELFSSYRQIADSVARRDIKFGQGSASWFLKKIVKDGPYKGLMDAIGELKKNLDDVESKLANDPKNQGLLQAKNFLQRNIGRAYALGAAFRGGSIMSPGQGFIDGRLDSLSPDQITRRMQMRAGVDIDLTMGESVQKKFGNNQAVKLFGNYMDRYSTVLQFVEFLPKVAAVLAKNDLMLSAGSNSFSGGLLRTFTDMDISEGLYGAREQIKKQINVVEEFAKNAREVQEKYDRTLPGPAKVQAEKELNEAINSLEMSRKDLNEMNDLIAKQERALASAARNVGTPDVRLAGKSAPRIDNYLRFYSYNIEGMRRTFEQIGDAFADGAKGKTRVALMMAPILSLMVIRESILGMMGDDGKEWDQLVNPERYKYSIPLPMGIMRWTDDNGDQRNAAYGVGIPIPDAMRMFNGLIEGALNRGSVDRNLAGFIEDTVQSTASSVADFVGPSLNPVLDIGGVMGALAIGNNPNRGLNPFTSSKVMPRGTNVPDEERRAVLAQYILQRTGLSSWLPSVSGDKPDWFVPGGFRSTFFVDEGGIMTRAFKAGEAVAPQKSERIAAIMRGEYPEGATVEDVKAAFAMQAGGRKAPAIRVLENMTAASARNYGSTYRGSESSAIAESMKMGEAARRAFLFEFVKRNTK